MGRTRTSQSTYGGLSVGITPRRQRVVSDGVREALEAHLFHISLVDEPAYQEAQVLAVRAADDALTVAVEKLLGRDWSALWQ